MIIYFIKLCNKIDNKKITIDQDILNIKKVIEEIKKDNYFFSDILQKIIFLK